MGSQSLGPTLVLVGLAVIIVPFVVLFFLSLGAAAWLLFGGALVAVSLREADDFEEGDRSERTSCDACGADRR